MVSLDLEDDNRVLIFNHVLDQNEQNSIKSLVQIHAQNLFQEDKASFDSINESIKEYLYLDKKENYLYKLAFYLDNFKKETLKFIKTEESNPYCLQANSNYSDFDYLTKATLFTEIIPNVTLNHPSKDYIEAFIIDVVSEQTIFNCEFDTRYQSAVSQVSQNFDIYKDEIDELRPIFAEKHQLDLFLENKDYQESNQTTKVGRKHKM
jgi:hypothetical protein